MDLASLVLFFVSWVFSGLFEFPSGESLVERYPSASETSLSEASFQRSAIVEFRVTEDAVIVEKVRIVRAPRIQPSLGNFSSDNESWIIEATDGGVPVSRVRIPREPTFTIVREGYGTEEVPREANVSVVPLDFPADFLLIRSKDISSHPYNILGHLKTFCLDFPSSDLWCARVNEM